MKRIVLGLMLLSLSLFAQKAVLVDIISENIIKVKKEGEVKKLHLVGIELFAKANNSTKEISFEQKQDLKELALAYMKKSLKIGEEFSYAVVYTDTKGVEKIWIDKKELNYKMIRDGYALVDLNDPFLPSFFQMRMTLAMKYAKDKKLGLWADSVTMTALIDNDKHMCGWKNKKTVPYITKQAILEEQKDALPNAAKIYLARKLALK